MSPSLGEVGDAAGEGRVVEEGAAEGEVPRELSAVEGAALSGPDAGESGGGVRGAGGVALSFAEVFFASSRERPCLLHASAHMLAQTQVSEGGRVVYGGKDFVVS